MGDLDELEQKIDLCIDDFREAAENISYQSDGGYVTPDDLEVFAKSVCALVEELRDEVFDYLRRMRGIS